jgi:hypothetical protein
MKKLFPLVAILVVALTSVTSAQQQEPSLKPTVPAKNSEAPPKLLLEIVYIPELRVRLLPIQSSFVPQCSRI